MYLNGRVYFGGIDGFAYCLDAKTGKEQWKFETGDQIVGGPNWTKSADGKKTYVLIGSHDFFLYCLEAETGKKVWEYESENYINGSPALTEGRTMFGGCDAMLHVIDITKGEKDKMINANSYIIGSVAADTGRVYVGHHDNEFLCIDLKAGKIVWNYKDRPFPYSYSPSVTKDHVLFGGQDKRLHCVRRDN